MKQYISLAGSENRVANFTKRMHALLSFYPLAMVFLFELFVARSYLELGRLPFVYNPDPKDLGFDLHHNLIWFMGFCYPLAVLLWLLGGFSSKFTRNTSWLMVSGILLSILAWYAQRGLVNWFLD